MRSAIRLVAGGGISAGLMYLFDPRSGKRRRAIARDKVARLAHRAGDVVEVTSRDVRNRATGRIARIRSWVARRESSDDEIARRIRSRLETLVRHPTAVSIRVDEGRVMLSGPVLDDEFDRVLARVAAIRGVKGVESHLAVHEASDLLRDQPGEVPEERRQRRVGLMPAVWSPTARLAAGMSGSALTVYAARRFDLLGVALGVVGVGLLARGVSNRDLKRLLGLTFGREAIHVQKTIDVSAPVRNVFEFWAHVENWPQVMAHVREVRETARDRHHWVIAGPAGVPISWDTILTKFGSNRVIEWETLPGSTVRHSGSIRFRQNPDGTTRVEIKMSFIPLVGALGHGVAALFGTDPKTAMDQDLARFKALVEHGGAL